MTKVLIIGGGFAGCCAAHVLEKKNWQIDLIESSNILGGGVLTHWYGGHPYTYGPRHFIGPESNYKAFEFLNKIVPLRHIKKMNYSVIKVISPAIQGMITSINHLLKVEDVK